MDDCSICLDEINSENICVTECNHKYCKDCLEKLLSNENLNCPMCRRKIKKFTYLGEIHKLVYIIKKDILPIPTTINVNEDNLIDKKYLKYLFGGLFMTFISPFISNYFFINNDRLFQCSI